MEVEEEGGGSWQAQAGRKRKKEEKENKSKGKSSQVSEEESKKGAPKVLRVDENKERKVIFKLASGSAGFRSFNPIRLAKMIKEELGEVKNAQILADGKLLVVCASEDQMVKAVALKVIGEKQVECFVPGNNKADGLKGVVYGVSLEMSMNELVRGIEGGKAVGATRIRSFRDGVKRDTTTVIITFQGSALPEKVFLGCLSFRVQPYRRPPLRCYKCQRYGHIAAGCRGIRRCGKCGGSHEFAECKETVLKCGTCGGPHIAGSRECGYFKQAVKVQDYRETNKDLSYADVVKHLKKCEEVGEMRRGEECPPQKTTVPQDSILVNKVNFLAFIVEVMSGLKLAKNNSDIVRVVIKAAERDLGISDVDPGFLHSFVFSKDRMTNTGVLNVVNEEF